MPVDDDFTDMLTLHVCPVCGWERYVPVGTKVTVRTTYLDGKLFACAHHLENRWETSWEN